MTTPMPTPPQSGAIYPGWYADPTYPEHQQRYWSGTAWTEHVAPRYAPPPPMQAAATLPGDGSGPADVAHWLVPIGRSGESITAGYLGLLSTVIVILGPLAILFGVLGLRRASRGEGHGRGRSIFGIVAGVWGTFWTVMIVISTLSR